MVCTEEREAARVQSEYGIRAVSSTDRRPFGAHRGNVVIYDWLRHESPRALLADAMIATGRTGATVICVVNDWFDVMTLKELDQSLGLGDDHPEAEDQ